jgi:hypothetical protein
VVDKMERKILVLLLSLGLAVIFCGVCSAATVQNNHMKTFKMVDAGLASNYQENPVISGSNVVWEEITTSGYSLYV